MRVSERKEYKSFYPSPSESSISSLDTELTMAHTVRIAMLNADIPVPNVLLERGTYGNIFHRLLSTAAERISPHVKIESKEYDVRKHQYPISASDIDLVLVTGSASSAYDDLEWVRRLDAYVLYLYINHPHIKLFGSCFGHQLICQSLLRNHGVRVEADPNGWELGVKEIELTREFQNTLHANSTNLQLSPIPGRLRLQFVHADHVKLPSEAPLPEPWIAIGSTEHCAVQGVYEPGRVLTFQGHFEFDRFVNTETLKVFFSKWDSEVLQETLEACDKDDDAEVAAEIVVRFLLEEIVTKRGSTMEVAGGLLTPP